jgi:hypothetical protein
MSEEEREREVKVLNRAINDLSEYFDTVQVFVTRHEPAEGNGTIEYNGGLGNFYARLGHTEMWVEEQKNANLTNSFFNLVDEEEGEGDEDGEDFS